VEMTLVKNVSVKLPLLYIVKPVSSRKYQHPILAPHSKQCLVSAKHYQICPSGRSNSNSYWEHSRIRTKAAGEVG